MIGRRSSASLSLAAALLLGGAGSAAAHTNQVVDGCTGINTGLTCLQVHGIRSTTHVDHFVQARDAPQPLICNYQAKFTVKSSSRGTYWTKWSAYHSGCFYFNRVTRSSGTVEKNFDSPSTACGTWYEDGGALGTACLNLVNK